MEKSWDRRSRWLATVLYALIVGVLAWHHEMWRDEVRAFSVAIRNPSWSSLLLELRHEGHPVLWYALLRIGFALTHSNLVLPVVAAATGIVTAWLIMKYAPFPVWLRLLAVFGSFLVYDLTVVARNYGIGVLLMICACMAFRHRSDRPLLLALCLALMANTSVHAALAALVILGAWMLDLLDERDRPGVLSLQAILSVLIVLSAAGFAFWTARPTPDMAWALSSSTLSAGKIIRTIFSDPGMSLRGVGSDPGAVAELPWRMLNTDFDFQRWIIDAAFAWLLWKFRKDWKALLLVVLTAVGFGILFRNVYSGGARHEGLLLFLFFSIAWISVVRAREHGNDESAAKTFASGLLPLFALQTLALPVVASRYVSHAESSSKSYGAFVRAHPEYRNAILMAEPDYMMEALPYYVPNRVYMPRQREFQWRVYFDNGQKRVQSATLTDIASIADSVACVEQVPVLLAISNRYFEYRSTGADSSGYRTRFKWNTPEWVAFRAAHPLVTRFPHATTDEIYRVFEVRCRR